MKSLISLLLILLLASCYSVPDVNYIESKPVLQDITSFQAYRADCTYFITPPFGVKSAIYNFYMEEDITYFHEQTEIAIQKAIDNAHYAESDSVVLRIYSVDKRGNYTAPIFRWRGASGYYNTQRGYVYQKILK